MLTTDESQTVFTDTPGFHKPRTLLGERLNRMVEDSTEGVDTVVLVVDAAAGVGRVATPSWPPDGWPRCGA